MCVCVCETLLSLADLIPQCFTKNRNYNKSAHMILAVAVPTFEVKLFAESRRILMVASGKLRRLVKGRITVSAK